MPDVTISPNMNLPVPVVSEAPGPEWANSLNSCLGAIDSHDHSSGQGVQINPNGMNINDSLPMQNNLLTGTKAVVFQAQASLATLKATYVIGADLYYNDGNGNVIRVTESGSVAGATGTITGLPSGTASASYQSVGGTFRFQSATNTPANVSAATVLISEQTTSPNFISLKSPTSLASSYNVTFPAAVPGATSILRMDTSGTISNNLVVDNSSIEISANTLQVKDLGITTAKLAANAVTTAKITDENVTRAKIVNSSPTVGSETGAYGTTSTSFTTVTNCSQVVTTYGRPIFIFLIAGNNASPSYVGVQHTAGGNPIGYWRIRRDGVQLCSGEISYVGAGAGSPHIYIPPATISFLDTTVTAGSVTYDIQVRVNGASQNFDVVYCKMVVLEYF